MTHRLKNVEFIIPSKECSMPECPAQARSQARGETDERVGLNEKPIKFYVLFHWKPDIKLVY